MKLDGESNHPGLLELKDFLLFKMMFPNEHMSHNASSSGYFAKRL
jgi:hypothetical protein